MTVAQSLRVHMPHWAPGELTHKIEAIMDKDDVAKRALRVKALKSDFIVPVIAEVIGRVASLKGFVEPKDIFSALPAYPRHLLEPHFDAAVSRAGELYPDLATGLEHA